MGSASSSHVNSSKNQGQPVVLKKTKVHCQKSETTSSGSINLNGSVVSLKSKEHCFEKNGVMNDGPVVLSSGDYFNVDTPVSVCDGFQQKAPPGKEAPADIDLRVKNLETDLAKAYSHNLDLEDQIQSLKETLNCSKLTVISEEPEVADDAKTTLISSLQIELDELKSEFQKLRLKHRRKIKVLTAKLNEAQQSSQIQKLEMLEEVNQLKQTNTELTVKLKQSQTSNQTVISEDESTGNLSDRTNLIVELSAQVSEQSQIIAELRVQLAEKQKEIDVFKSQIVQTGSKTDCWERSSRNHISPHPPDTHISSLKSGRKKTYKIGQRRCIETSNKQLAFYKTVREVSSDSDSDWTNEIVASKIHSAPSAVRTELTC